MQKITKGFVRPRSASRWVNVEEMEDNIVSWNYRIIKHKTDDPEEPFWYGMHEVYYADISARLSSSTGEDERIPHSYTEQEVGIAGASVEEMKQVMLMMFRAFKEPVLEAPDFVEALQYEAPLDFKDEERDL